MEKRKFGKTSQEDLARIKDVFPKNAASGLRYPEVMMKTVNG